jgi:hypothetical protein
VVAAENAEGQQETAEAGEEIGSLTNCSPALSCGFLIRSALFGICRDANAVPNCSQLFLRHPFFPRDGQGEIRTLDTGFTGMPVFETGAFSHSATCPTDGER